MTWWKVTFLGDDQPTLINLDYIAHIDAEMAPVPQGHTLDTLLQEGWEGAVFGYYPDKRNVRLFECSRGGEGAEEAVREQLDVVIAQLAELLEAHLAKPLDILDE